MTTGVRVWAAATFASVLVHAGAVFLFFVLLQPAPIPEQDAEDRQFRVESYDVATQRAEAQEPDAERQTGDQPDAPRLAGATIPVSKARPVVARTETASGITAETVATVLGGSRAETEIASAVSAVPGAPVLASTFDQTETLKPGRPTIAEKVIASLPSADEAASARVPETRIDWANGAGVAAKASSAETAAIQLAGLSAPESIPLRQHNTASAQALRPRAQTASRIGASEQTEVTLATVSASDASAISLLGARISDDIEIEGRPLKDASDILDTAELAQTPRLAPSSAPSTQVATIASDDLPAATTEVSGAAFEFGINDQVDAISIAAVQSFLAPNLTQTQSGPTARDGIAAVLSREVCARLQAEFLPETGQIELRGHVPDNARRGPVLEILSRLVGASIPVVDNVKILPRPQCEVLTGIENLGLPQSTDQRSDPKLVGEDAHARSYSYVSGQRLVLDVAAPDYPAYVYVDYFDAEGQVVHLVPNDQVEVLYLILDETSRIGAGADGGRFLDLIVGPPYGQEVAAAFATSHPLYDTPRPLREPAGPYLAWLSEQVARVDASVPHFKGEWVYFHVATSE